MTEGQPLVRLGIAGLGQAGAALVPALGRTQRVVVTAVADPFEDTVAAFRRDFPVEGHASVEALCESEAVDLVYIATPTHLHARHARIAIAAGKHVIVEKPMAVTMDEAEGMIAAAEGAGVHLMVGQSQSFEPPVRAMRDLVASGEIGPLRMLHTWNYTDWVYRPRAPEELDSARGGGALFRQGPHQVDVLRWIGGGMVRSVRASVGSWDAARGGDGAHTLFLEFENGVVATAVYSGYGHFDSRDLTAGIGEDGRPASESLRGRGGLESDVNQAARKRLRGYRGASTPDPTHASTYGLTVVSGERGDLRQSPGGLLVHSADGTREVPVPAVPTGRDVMLEEASNAVALGQRPAHDGPWGRANLEVCLAALESARTGREIPLRYQIATPS